MFDPKVLAKPFRPFVVHGLAGVPETAVKLAIGVINSAISVGIGALSLAAIENVSGIKHQRMSRKTERSGLKKVKMKNQESQMKRPLETSPS